MHACINPLVFLLKFACNVFVSYNKMLDCTYMQWNDKDAYEETVLKLAGLFKKNFETFTNYQIGTDDTLTQEILAAGPNF